MHIVTDAMGPSGNEWVDIARKQGNMYLLNGIQVTLFSSTDVNGLKYIP